MHLLQNVFLAMLLCFGAGATAQIPGYMGKRLLIDAEIQAFPALLSPTASGNHLWGKDYREGTYGLHSRLGLGAGYVLSRHQMVQAHVSYLRTGTNVSMAKRGSTELHDLLNVVTGWTFDLAYSRTKLNRGHIAPLGKQKAYHIYRTMVNGNNNLYKNKQLIDNQLFGGIDAKHTIYGIGYSVTYNKVIKDQFLLTYGWRMNLSSPHLWFRLLGEDPSYDELHTTDYKLANLNRFKTAVTNKFFISDMLQFKIGFGILR